MPPLVADHFLVELDLAVHAQELATAAAGNAYVELFSLVAQTPLLEAARDRSQRLRREVRDGHKEIADVLPVSGRSGRDCGSCTSAGI